MTTRILQGHVLDQLALLPDKSVHCVVTSVPYWGLRAYGTEPQVWGGEIGCEHRFVDATIIDTRHLREDEPSAKQATNVGSLSRGVRPGAFCIHCHAWRGEHGLEPSLDLWLTHEVEIWRAVRRVLRDDGTIWVNCGDAYASTPNGRKAADIVGDDRTFRDRPIDTTGGRFKPKDRMLMPARLAIALQADGWWLRDEIIWHKLNPMPSSVRDRTTPAHEFVYMLSKKPRYFYDPIAIAEPVAVEGWDDGSRVFGGVNKHGANARHGDRTTGRRANPRPAGWGEDGPHTAIATAGRGHTGPGIDAAKTRNKRSVWSLASEPFPAAHFATYPTALVAPCILAGTSAKGCCPACGAPWVRLDEVEFKGDSNKKAAVRGNGSLIGESARTQAGGGYTPAKRNTLKWVPSCTCPPHEPVPCTVLDPFAGSGTTALVAERCGRDAILIELNPEYVEIATRRLRSELPTIAIDGPDAAEEALPLFGVPQ